MSVSDDFQKILEENPIVLFMKGNAAFPMDSFGASVVQYLNDVGYRPRTIDILQDPEIKRSLRDATHATPPPCCTSMANWSAATTPSWTA